MRIVVCTHTGHKASIEVEGTMTVTELKSLIQKQEGILVTEQILIFQGEELGDDNTLDFYNVRKDATIHVVARAAATRHCLEQR